MVDALGHGQQSLILRKGGLVEGPDGFSVEHPRFLIFPTQFHQQRNQVIPPAQARFDALISAAPDPDLIRLEWMAEVVGWSKVTSLEEAQRLRPFHIWRDEVISERFHWGGETAVFVLLLRVSRLAEPVELTLTPAYAGCRSWIELEADVSTAGSRAVIPDDEFGLLRHRIEAALGCPWTSPVTSS